MLIVIQMRTRWLIDFEWQLFPKVSTYYLVLQWSLQEGLVRSITTHFDGSVLIGEWSQNLLTLHHHFQIVLDL